MINGGARSGGEGDEKGADAEVCWFGRGEAGEGEGVAEVVEVGWRWDVRGDGGGCGGGGGGRHCVRLCAGRRSVLQSEGQVDVLDPAAQQRVRKKSSVRCEYKEDGINKTGTSRAEVETWERRTSEQCCLVIDRQSSIVNLASSPSSLLFFLLSSLTFLAPRRLQGHDICDVLSCVFVMFVLDYLISLLYAPRHNHSKIASSYH